MDEFIVQSVFNILKMSNETEIDKSMKEIEQYLKDKGIFIGNPEVKRYAKYLNDELKNHPYFKIVFDDPINDLFHIN